jgi:hypothetical protein
LNVTTDAKIVIAKVRSIMKRYAPYAEALVAVLKSIYPGLLKEGTNIYGVIIVYLYTFSCVEYSVFFKNLLRII